jgi:orotidine-5'-phosphate decarboxylase
MNNYADRLIEAIKAKGNSCVVGLDPRLEQMPRFVWEGSSGDSSDEAIRSAIRRFHKVVIEAVAPYVPAVKPQVAFYEQYGLGGMMAFRDTIDIAKRNGLIVVVDAKRNDISSTAQAYANAFLGCTRLPTGVMRAFDVDCITVSPFLGRDSLVPFVETCCEHGKGIFILVKTSNPGSVDLQDQQLLKTGERVYVMLAKLVDELASAAVGKSGYSSIGAVVGATFPEEADTLRKLMPRSFFLVPGYGAQGGTAGDAMHCFNPDKLGAVVNASRSVTYAFESTEISEIEYSQLVQSKTKAMIDDIAKAARRRFGA